MGNETKTVSKIDRARALVEEALAGMRKQRGGLKVINADLRSNLITTMVDEVGFAPSSAKKAFAKIRGELLEAGVIGEPAPEPEPEPRAPKKIDVARDLFNAQCHKLNTTDMPAADFRRDVIGRIMKATGVNEATACAMYNTCKSDATLAGLVDEGRLGRHGQPVDHSLAWARVNSAGDAVATFPTKKAASEGLVEGQTVAKTDELVAA